ncbi:DUF488 domain-containing protein [Streptomyces sp. NPDC001530]|uniref:DUF488 domain-containing protein n=1 Tax=Streptomyces sp. NPDC001530 TaxID=3364582 RepID=UPI0036BA279B
MAKVKDIRYHRIYEEVSPEDGVRVLVDRVWPRGLRKDDAHLDAWLRDVAPSTELRRWYAHDPERYQEFRKRYLAELRDPDHQQALRELDDLARRGRVTLLTATRDVDHSQAAVLADRLSHGSGAKT